MSLTLQNNGTPEARQRAMDAFITSFRETGDISKSARAAGVARYTIYEWRQKYPDFQQRCMDCRDWHIENLEASTYQQSLDGNPTLAIFLLKSWKPEVYRDSLHIAQVSATAEQLAGRFGIEPEQLLARAEGLLAERSKLPAASQQRIAATTPKRVGRYQDP